MEFKLSKDKCILKLTQKDAMTALLEGEIENTTQLPDLSSLSLRLELWENSDPIHMTHLPGEIIYSTNKTTLENLLEKKSKEGLQVSKLGSTIGIQIDIRPTK